MFAIGSLEFYLARTDLMLGGLVRTVGRLGSKVLAVLARTTTIQRWFGRHRMGEGHLVMFVGDQGGR